MKESFRTCGLKRNSAQGRKPVECQLLAALSMLPTWAHHRAVVLSTSITRLPHLLFGQNARRVSAQVVRQSLSEWYGRVQVLARPSCSLPVRPLTHRQVMRSSFSSSRRPAPQPRPSGSIETLRLLGRTDDSHHFLVNDALALPPASPRSTPSRWHRAPCASVSDSAALPPPPARPPPVPTAVSDSGTASGTVAGACDVNGRS